MKRYLPALVSAVIVIFSAAAQAVELETLEQRFSYTMGVRMAELLQTQGVNQLDANALAAAVADQFKGGELRMTREQMSAALQEHQENSEKAMRQQAAVNLENGKKFLAENATKPGIVKLDNGLQYLIIRAGDGAQPDAGAKVKVHYRGTLINGEEFDSSYARGEPVEFPLGNVIVGFREAISRMKTGAKWKVFVPAELAYGATGAGSSIGPNETLIFEIELLEIL